MAKSTEVLVLAVLKGVVPRPLRGGVADHGLRLREDLDVGSLALISIAVDLCDRLGADPAALDLGSFMDRVESLGDLIAAVDELRLAQNA